MDDLTKSDGQNAAGENRGWQLTRFDILMNPPIWLVSPLYDLATLFALAVIILVGIGLFAAFHIAYETAVGAFSSRIEAAKVFFPIILALVGGPLLIWRVVTAHVQAQAARKQAETDREGLYTDLFTKAIEQLGATREVTEFKEKKQQPNEIGLPVEYHEVTETKPNLEVRLGAIYALERIAQDSERDHWPIMEVLCAYVRQNSGKSKKVIAALKQADFEDDALFDERSKSIRKSLAKLPEPRADVQAALTVIGRRSKYRRDFESLRAADASDPDEYRLDFRRANLQRVDLRGLFFDRARFDEASIDGASLVDTHLAGARFFRASLISANAASAILNDANFRNANLEAAQLHECQAVGTSFSSAILVEAWLVKGNFVKAGFNSTNLARCWAYRADFSDCSFWRAILRKSELAGCRLLRANFRKANLNETSLKDAALYGADFRESLDLGQDQVASAFEGDSSTKFDKHIECPSNWPASVLAPSDAESRLRELEKKLDDEVPF